MQRHGIAGKVALVTGAGGDIGRAIAVGLADAGADVVLADLPTAGEAVESTRVACREANADVTGRVHLFDVRDPDATNEAFASTTDQLGPIQLIVNNAGYQGVFANVLDYPLDDARTVLDVNSFGVLVVLRAAAQHLRAAGVGGSVVNVASMAWHGAPNMPAYSMSKAAVVGLTRSAAKDLAPYSIRVNSVSPGFIGPGAMWDRQVAEQAAVVSPYYLDDVADVADQMIGMVPLDRYGSVDEVASAVGFLLSDDSSYITGSDLEIAGGAA